MMIPHVVQTEADKVFVNFLNVQAVTVQNGDSIVWDTGTADGVRATQPATATLSLQAGIVDGDTAASSYGLAQAYGYRSQGLVTNTTNTAIASGDILVPTNAADYLSYHVDSTNKKGLSGIVYAGEAFATATTPAAALKKVFIRAL